MIILWPLITVMIILTRIRCRALLRRLGAGMLSPDEAREKMRRALDLRSSMTDLSDLFPRGRCQQKIDENILLVDEVIQSCRNVGYPDA